MDYKLKKLSQILMISGIIGLYFIDFNTNKNISLIYNTSKQILYNKKSKIVFGLENIIKSEELLGVDYKLVNTNVNGVNNSYNIIKINNEDIRNGNLFLNVVVNENKLKDIEEVSGTAKAAINGGFYDKDFKPIGIIKSNGEIISSNPSNSKNKGYFVINNNGNYPEIIRNLGNLNNYSLVVESYPILRINNVDLVRRSNFPSSRSVIALDKERNIYFITTRGLLSNRVQYLDLLDLANQEGYTCMINLDGGASSASFMKKNFVQNSIRSTSSIIGVYRD